MRELKGTLEKVKEDSRNIIYEIKIDTPGLNGSIYIDRLHLPVFDKLILVKST